jgi:hypothetical protein
VSRSSSPGWSSSNQPLTTYVGSPRPPAVTAAAVADAQTRLAHHRRRAAVAVTTLYVPAEVRCTRSRPVRSDPATPTGELEKSNPATRRPRFSPIARVPGRAAFTASASSTDSTSQIRRAPASNAYAAVVNARSTSTTTTAPVASAALDRGRNRSMRRSC